MSQSVGDVQIKVELDKASLRNSLGSARGDVDSWASGVESRTSKLGSAIGGALKTGMLAAGAAAAGAATAGLVAYKDLESASASAASKSVEVNGKTTEEIKKQYDSLKEHVESVSRDLGASTIFDPTEVAKTYDVLAAKGVNIATIGKTQLLPFLDLAAASQSDLASVTDLVAGSINAFGLSMNDSQKVADMYAKGLNASSASQETFNYALRQGGATAAAAGMPLNEYLAIVGKLTDKNYTGEQSGAALKTALMGLYKETPVLDAALKKLGLTYADVDPRAHKFLDTIDLLKSKNADIGDFGSVFTESSGAIMQALSEDTKGVRELTASIADSDGLAHTTATLVMDTDKLPGSFEAAKGATSELATAIGKYLEPAAVSLMNAWSALTPALEEFGAAIGSGDWGKVGTMIQDGIRQGMAGLANIGSWIWSLIGPSVESLAPKVNAALADIGTGTGIAALTVGMMALVPTAAAMSVGVVGRFVAMSLGSLTSLATMVGQVAVRYALMAGTAAGHLVRMTAMVLGEFAMQKAIAISNLVAMVPVIGAKYAMMAQAAIFNLGIMMTTSAQKWGAMVAFAIMHTATMAGGVLAGYAAMASGALASVAAMVTGTIAGLASLVAALAAPVALIVAGLASIGYALDPGKFVIFNKTATDAFNGIKSVVLDCWDAIQKGDWNAVGERLKKAFGDAIGFVKALDWKGLGSELMTATVDGAKAIIDYAFQIGTWIHDKATSWISAGGPRKLGQDIADAIGGAIASWFNSDTSIWDALKTVWGAVTDWIGIGWQIVSGIAQGLLDRMYNAVQPAANKLLASFATASYEVQGTFARTWNTILIGSANLVTGILSAFSTVGTTIAGYLQPVITKLTDIYNAAKNVISLGGGGGGQPPATQPRDSSGNWAATSEGGNLNNGETYTATYSGTPDKSSDTGIDYSSRKSEGIASGLISAGYLTGGKGFISKELQSAGDGKLYMITDQGDFVTLTGKETVAKSIFDLISPYTADYITNSREAGQAWADKVMPVGDKIVSSEKTASDTRASSTKEAATQFKQSVYSTATDFFGVGKQVATDILAAGQGAASALTQAGQGVQQATGYAATALRLGAEVGAKFTTDAGNAVRIGLTQSGQQMAVIGQVAQQQFQSAGGQFVSSVSGAGNTVRSSLQTGGATAQTALQTGATSIYGAAGAVNSAAASLANNAVWNGSLYNQMYGKSGSSVSSTSTSTSSGSGSGLDGWGGKPKGMATGSMTSGPQLAMIGEDGPGNPEFVIPTKTKRWDLLLAAMKAYGLKGFAEGTATGTAGSPEGDAPPMSATFGITGLAAMSNSVKKILSDLKDYFRLTWGIVKSEAATYWKGIEKVISDEVTVTRNGAWQGAIDIRNTWIDSNRQILADTKTSWGGMWAAIEPSMVSVHDGILSSFTDAESQVVSVLDQMRNDAVSSLQTFQSDWGGVWSQLMADLSSTASQISSVLQSMGATLSNIAVNASVNIGGGGGGGYGSSPEGFGTGDVNMNGASSSGGFTVNPDGTANFQDVTCMGDLVLVNALKYTNPSGNTSYINPFSYIGGGGISKYQGAGNAGGGQVLASSGGGGVSYANGGFTNSIWSAEGGVFDRPATTHIAERGVEMVLPTKLTKMFLSMADAGAGGGGSPEISIVVENYWDGRKVTDLVMSKATKTMKLRGAKPVV